MQQYVKEYFNPSLQLQLLAEIWALNLKLSRHQFKNSTIIQVVQLLHKIRKTVTF